MLDLEALLKLSYGMYVVSSGKPRRFNGCIVNTVFQLTSRPLMVGMSLNLQSLTNEYIKASNVFTASILSEDAPMSLIANFGFSSGRDIDKFERVNYKIGQTGLPIVLDNTIAYFEAEVVQSVDIATHTLFVAGITACEKLDSRKAPMTYAYYRDIKHGRTPKTAATYLDINPQSP